MKELSLREIQLGELEVLKKLAEICEAQNLKYYLIWGTLLGAVRHKGFIPWDDDVDVAMPRPDFDKLMEYLESHQEEIRPFSLISCKTNKKYIYPIPRFCDTRYYIDYQGAKDYGLGLFVDIFPMDGCGNDESAVEASYKKRIFYESFTCLAGNKKFQKSNQGWWRNPVKFAMYSYAKLMGPKYFAHKLEKLAVRYTYEESEYVCIMLWDDQKRPFKKADVDEVVYIPFEGTNLPVPKGYDEVLRNFYGDYMQLPPEEKRVAHHYYTAYLKDEN